MYTIKEILDTDFDNEVLRADLPVLVEFFAPWCVPCRKVSEILSRIADNFHGRIKICKLNVDGADTPNKYSILSIPALFLFNKGQVVDSIFGLTTKDKIEESLYTNL